MIGRSFGLKSSLCLSGEGARVAFCWAFVEFEDPKIAFPSPCIEGIVFGALTKPRPLVFLGFDFQNFPDD